jgi:hypothetical protein
MPRSPRPKACAAGGRRIATSRPTWAARSISASAAPTRTRIESLQPGTEVRWLYTGAHIAAAELTHKDEWVGTLLVFRLTPDVEARTRLDFEHVGLVPAFECYGLCSNGWRHYLGSLQQFIESGRGTPYELAGAAAK